MTTPLRTYADKLREEGFVTTDEFQCPECDGPPQPAFAIVETAPGRWVCSTCHIKEQDAIRHAAEQKAKAQLAPWDTETGGDVKRQRTLLQEKWRWAVMPDSPLHADAQARVMQFLKLLNTLTIDYPSPEDMVWPAEPVIGVGDYDAQDA